MSISPKFIDAFIRAANYGSKIMYRDYTMRLMKRAKEIHFLKGARILATWKIEEDKIIVSNDIKGPEKTMVKKFSQLPRVVDENIVTINQDNNERELRPIEKEILNVFEDNIKNLREEEITGKKIWNIIYQLSERYLYSLQYTGGNPDRFADAIYIYEQQTILDIRNLLLNFHNKRIVQLVAEPKDKVYWDRYSDEELAAIAKIVPKKAQREGNLVTITEEQHNYFSSLCSSALKYISLQIKNQSLRKYVPRNELMIYWWESQPGKYFGDFEEKEVLAHTFREKLLQQIEPKPARKAKPSRLKVLIYFNDSEVGDNVFPMIKKTVPQLGVINWDIRTT